MNRKLLSIILAFLFTGVMAACTQTPQTPVTIKETVVVEKQGETIVQTVEVPVEKAIVVTATPEPAKDALQRVKDKKVLFVGFNFEPPYDYITDTGEFTGLDIDFTKYCAQQIGITQTLGVQTPWDGLIPGLLAGNYDVISAGMARRPARMEVVDFSDAIYMFGPNAVVPKGNPNNVHSWDDIVNKKLRVGTVLGSTDYADCTDTYKLGDLCHGYQEYPQIVADLRAGRLDVIVQAELTQRRYLASEKPTDIELAVPWKYPSESRVGIAFRKGDDSLREAFNGCIATIKTNGVLAGILTKYGLSADNIIPGKE
jgi:polar amino acid transport system substrate-binding protein